MNLSLTTWYAEPLTAEQAKQRSQRAYQKQVECVVAQLHHDSTPYVVDELVSAFWLGKDYHHVYNRLLKTHADTELHGLLTLVLGQLLLSRKLHGAHETLQRALQVLNPYLSAKDYLELMRRHELLRVLPLSETAQPAAGLAQLENEAGVIQKLKGKHRTQTAHSRKDTLG